MTKEPLERLPRRSGQPRMVRTMTGSEQALCALTLDGIDAGVWQLRTKGDAVARALADRHYSRQTIGASQVGPPGRLLVMVTPCERAAWITHYPDPALAMDKLDVWRCSMFRNEGAGLSSELILAAMDLTEERWGDPPTGGWATWVDTRKVRHKRDPGRCFLRAGWWLDDWQHRYLVRLRA